MKGIMKTYEERNSEAKGEYLEFGNKVVNEVRIFERTLKSVQWKIEKRVLHRIGHVLRMGNDRLKKSDVLGGAGNRKGLRRSEARKEDCIVLEKTVEGGWD